MNLKINVCKKNKIRNNFCELITIIFSFLLLSKTTKSYTTEFFISCMSAKKIIIVEMYLLIVMEINMFVSGKKNATLQFDSYKNEVINIRRDYGKIFTNRAVSSGV